jgi:hypothetical protein
VEAGMKNLLACLGVWLVVAASWARPAPARLPYEPEPPAKQYFIHLAGTTWIGMLYQENSKVTFHADGTLTYGEVGSGSPGIWKLNGNNLYFEINKYSEYQTIVQGDIILGTGTNKAGQGCKPNLKRVALPMIGAVP